MSISLDPTENDSLKTEEKIEIIISSVSERENKLKQISLERLVFKMFRNNISLVFVINILINI